MSYDNTSVQFLEILPFFALLLGRELSRQTIQRGPTYLGHRTNVVDGEMIRVPRGQEFQRMDETGVMQGVGPRTALVGVSPTKRGFPPVELANCGSLGRGGVLLATMMIEPPPPWRWWSVCITPSLSYEFPATAGVQIFPPSMVAHN